MQIVKYDKLNVLVSWISVSLIFLLIIEVRIVVTNH